MTLLARKAKYRFRAGVVGYRWRMLRLHRRLPLGGEEPSDRNIRLDKKLHIAWAVASGYP